MEEKKSLTLKDWSDADKPREKMIEQGKKQLSNTELIAILLRSGLQGKNVIDVAREILAMASDSLTTLSRMDYRQLSSIKGMGEAKATTLMAALELGWRMQGEIAAERKVLIFGSSDLFHYMLPLVIDLDHEEFWAVYLNGQNKVLGRQRIAIGGQNATLADPRIIFRGALEHKATQLAVIHNHPSGSMRPSTDDKYLTKQLNEGGKILGIRLIEHIIIGITLDGKADYYSFHDDGML